MKLFASLLLAALVCNSGAAYAQSGTPVGFTSWTTSTRPKLPYAGQLGYNQNLQVWEWWNPASNSWQNPATVNPTGDISNSTVTPFGGQQTFTNQLLGSLLSKTGDISKTSVIVDGVTYNTADVMSGAVGVAGGGVGGIPLTEVDSPAKASSMQVCTAACDLYRMVVNITGTVGATASGWVLLFDQPSATCPANGVLSGASIAKPGLMLDTDGTRGSLSLSFASGVYRHYANGLTVCWSTGVDEFNLTLGGTVMSIHAGIRQ